MQPSGLRLQTVSTLDTCPSTCQFQEFPRGGVKAGWQSDPSEPLGRNPSEVSGESIPLEYHRDFQS